MTNAPTTDGNNGNADLVRGILIALALLFLAVGAFLIVASQGRVRASEVIDRVISFVAPSPAHDAVKKPRERASGGTSPPLVSPSAGPGPAGAAGSGSASAGASHGPVAASEPVHGSAAQALRDILRHFHGDQKRTASVTISTTGRISREPSTPLTQDLLPVEAVDGAALITGAAPAQGGR